MSRAFELGLEENARAFVIAENFNNVVPAVISFTAIHCPFSESAPEDRVCRAIDNVLLGSFHGVRSAQLCQTWRAYPARTLRDGDGFIAGLIPLECNLVQTPHRPAKGSHCHVGEVPL